MGTKILTCFELLKLKCFNFPKWGSLPSRVAELGLKWGLDLCQRDMNWRPHLLRVHGGYSNYFLTECATRDLKLLPISKDFSHSKNG